MPTKTRSLIPTRKWFATQVTALAGWAIALINVGVWTATVKIALVTIIAQALVGWLVPNDNTPGGVPVARASNQRGYVQNAVGLALLIVIVAVVLTIAAKSLWFLLLLLLLLALFA